MGLSDGRWGDGVTPPTEGAILARVYVVRSSGQLIVD